MVKEPRAVPKSALEPGEEPKAKDVPPPEVDVVVYRPPSQQGCQYPAPKPGEPIRQDPSVIAPQVAIMKGPKVREA